MWVEHHTYNQKMGGEVRAMLHISSDTQGKHWLSLGTNPLGNGNQMTISLGLVVQTKQPYERVFCKACSTIHMLLILMFTEHSC